MIGPMIHFRGPGQGARADAAARLAEVLPDDDVLWLVWDAVDACDLSAFEAAYRADGQGGRPYDPRLMLISILVCELDRIRSPSAMARACRGQVRLAAVWGGAPPSRDAFRTFMGRHRASGALAGFFAAVLRRCHDQGLVDLSVCAVDGTVMAASASKDAGFTHGGLAQLLGEVDEQIAALYARAGPALHRVDTGDEEQLSAYIAEHCAAVPAQIGRLNSKRLRITAALARAQERDDSARELHPTVSEKIAKLERRVENQRTRLQAELTAALEKYAAYQQRCAAAAPGSRPTGRVAKHPDELKEIGYRRAELATAQRTLAEARAAHPP